MDDPCDDATPGWFSKGEDDPLNPARGLVWGLVLGIGLWVVIGWLVWRFFF